MPIRLDVDRTGADEIVLFITGVIFQHAVEIGNVLEVVGVDVTTRQRGVRQDVILERFDLQVDTLLRQNRLRLLKDFGVRVLDAPTVRVSAQAAKLRALRVAAAINVSVFFMMMVPVFVLLAFI
ncbi:Uncharacterised protein [Leclercia adecarboxylata]|uniref:Uncharacterized protein n=1 Tax=Leclercia adecarboxylata TaxID=83655 RepID=A0A4U9HU46_9ENTR|nr:Uncharacterised protein [Leclercia adecarboxylata]